MHDWKIINLNYLLHDQELLKYNIVQSIEWSVSKKDGAFTVERNGTVDLASAGDVFVPLESITEVTAVNWAKNALGVDEAAKIEAEIDAELALLITPTHGSGIPWTEGGI